MKQMRWRRGEWGMGLADPGKTDRFGGRFKGGWDTSFQGSEGSITFEETLSKGINSNEPGKRKKSKKATLIRGTGSHRVQRRGAVNERLSGY